MNNAQFRKLLETPRPPPSNDESSQSMPPPAARTLGSKLRSSIPMTPRSLTTSNNEFARQLAARRAAEQPVKKFRSSAAPKGTKLASGYVDRAAALRQQDEDAALNDERERRLEALRELVKEGAIEHEEYVKQTKLLGGDINSTHLVKGLDFELLKKVKAGEDLMSAITGEDKQQEEDELDADEKLEQVLEQQVTAVERKKEKKVGQKAPQTRAEILAELKRQRLAAKAATQPVLGSKFRKIGDPKQSEKKDSDDEEIKVKHVMGEDGKIKRKVKRKDKERERQQKEASSGKMGMEPPTEALRVMGMMPPPKPGKPAEPEEDDDDDIFAGAGDYDPLAGISDSDDSDSDADAAGERSKRPKPSSSESAPSTTTSDKPTTDAPPPPTIKPSNLFDDSPDATTDDSGSYRPPTDPSSLLTSDPQLASVLHRAAQIGKKQESEEEKRRNKLIMEQERDSYDIDMGFGGSTNFDDDDDDDGMGGAKGTKRKRGGGKKKKGDKNDANVVGKIVEEKYGGGK